MPSIDSGLTSTGVIIGVNPSSTACAIAICSSAELQQRADAGQEVEPAARDLRAALDVDRAEQLAELEVVLRLLDVGHGADLAQHDEVVLAAGGRAVLRPGSGTANCAARSAASASVDRRLGRLDLRRQLLGADQQRVALVALRGRHQLAELLLLGPQRLEVGDRGPARLVGARAASSTALSRLATGALARSDQVRIFSQQSQVNHDW